MDELQYIEREAREQGESEYLKRCHNQGLCVECGGEGRTPNSYCTGDAAGGWADTCDACDGTGKVDHYDEAAYHAEARRERDWQC